MQFLFPLSLFFVFIIQSSEGNNGCLVRSSIQRAKNKRTQLFIRGGATNRGKTSFESRSRRNKDYNGPSGDINGYDDYNVDDERARYQSAPLYPEDEYEEASKSIYNRKNARQTRSTVAKYTSTLSSKALVAVFAAISSAVLVALLLQMIIGRIFNLVLVAVAAISALAVFFKGDIGDYARSIGVFTIILLQRFKIQKVLAPLVSQLRALFMIVERRPFPPGNNPWNYEPIEEDADILQEFKMSSTLFALAFYGLFLGYSISKPIPLFPNWLGALIGAGFIAYGGTFQNNRGDMLRFVGHSTYRGFAELLDIMDEVDLKQKIGIVLSKMLFFLKGIDKQYQIVRKVRKVVTEMLFRSTSMMYGMKGEDSNAANDRNRANRRKKSSPTDRDGRDGGEYYNTNTAPPQSYDDYDAYSERDGSPQYAEGRYSSGNNRPNPRR